MGWNMNDIDEMDIDYYIEIVNYKTERDYYKSVDSFANAPI
ncbi:MAG: hypothetical protein RSD63_08675 [Eubacterium sp.]